LVGNVDFGGSWINPQNITLPSSIDTAESIGGQFNYSYIVSNGVCPADTSNILVIVDASCDYLASLGELQASLLIYPNPTSNELTLDFGMNATEIDYILYDINGKIVLAENEISIENRKYIIGTSGILPGMYMLHINSKENSQVYRIIKN
jgi:energy-converting hydrogenase Eha subunit B